MNSKIIGVDLNPIRPIRNVLTHQADITTTQCRQLLRRDMTGLKADVVLHDGAPNVGADWRADAYQQSILTLHAVKLATEFLREGGMFITKVFRSADYTSLLWVFNQLFTKVEATKPHSSRAASAEIFVTCKGYYAPSKIDARMLDPNHVFKDDVDVHKAASGEATGQKPLSVLHPRALEHKRHRDGYNPSRGLLQTNTVSVSKYIKCHEPVDILSDSSALIFTEECQEFAEHPTTTAEIRALCSDLKIIGRGDFKLLLKWRLNLVREHRRQVAADTAAAAAAAGSAEQGSDHSNSGDGGSDDEEDRAVGELGTALTAAATRKKAQRKREAKRRQKLIRKHMYGMTGQAVDLEALNAEVPRFSLAALTGRLSSSAILDELAEVDLDTMDAAAQAGIDAIYEGEAPLNPMEEGSSDEEDDDDASSVDSAVLGDGNEEYMAAIEGQMDMYYAEFDAKRKKRAAVTQAAAEQGMASKGIRLTRRERMSLEANAAVAQAEGKLDYEHQDYLKLLAGMRSKDSKTTGRGRDSSSDDDSAGESDNSDGFWDHKKQDRLDASDDEEGVTVVPSGSGASAVAARWFSNPAFGDVMESGTVDFADPEAAGRGKKRGREVDDDGFDTDSGDDGLPEYMRNLPKSDRTVRKERLKRLREKEERLAAKRALDDDAALQVVPGAAEADLSEEEEEADVKLDGGSKKANKAARDLIRAGMGRALNDGISMGGTSAKAASTKAAAKEAATIQTVAPGRRKAAPGRDAIDVEEEDGELSAAASGAGEQAVEQAVEQADAAEESDDPRDRVYDSDTHAEILALGKMMKQHTGAKALVDASYNRYAFDDGLLPTWFVRDESKHFRPQLPVTKAEVERIKASFRDIAARPIHKVMEARARKNKRVQVKADKAKRAAEAIAGDETMSHEAKAKSIARARRGLGKQQRKKIYVVGTSGGAGSSGVKSAKRAGAAVVQVDRRTRSDTRGMKNAEKRHKSRSAKKRRQA
jgi:AdoMet-dependent rRNA methyltransferase SPB1